MGDGVPEPPKQDVDLNARDPLEVALSEFTEEKRQGQSPSIEAYALRYPQLANEIRDLFPLVENLERWKDDKEVECLRRNVPRHFSFDRLGEYQLIHELGRGGLGVVFEAVHAISQRTVAIKLLPWRFAADMSTWKDHLQREASTIAQLRHPNIVPIYSFSEDQGYYYYVMQFVDGAGLDKVIQDLKRSRMKQHTARRVSSFARPVHANLAHDSWRGFAKLAEEVAKALAYAHQQGVVHNDIKPSNLLVQANGQVIVTDFGIGRLDHSELADGDDREIRTLMYMAPERWNGPGTPRSDVYSLGVTLYELVTQTPLFDLARRSQLVNAILKHEPLNPRRRRPDVPEQLERIILKAMAKDARDRYTSATEMAEDLRRFIDRRPIKATDKGLVRRLVDWFRSRR
ncbi:serine/threonine-protein kinase [Schlesneria paludicola]|uniref:serine/threonine-protein kinase n=1 Tax=Schlesneria paludicola TaxID=360056 RepID=UPI00029AF104|nr:serine/threonine-protein kinase [Schlesneria paludicola]